VHRAPHTAYRVPACLPQRTSSTVAMCPRLSPAVSVSVSPPQRLNHNMVGWDMRLRPLARGTASIFALETRPPFIVPVHQGLHSPSRHAPQTCLPRVSTCAHGPMYRDTRHATYMTCGGIRPGPARLDPYAAAWYAVSRRPGPARPRPSHVAGCALKPRRRAAAGLPGI
jgi:hypothetical protein